MPVENQKPEDRPRMPPKVSVIIPLYNSARFIKNTLQSVADQTYKNVEILCVDDGSTDATKDVIAAHFPGVHYLYQNNKGPAAARNLGIKKATGDYIAFLDSDDIWLPEKLALQMERIFNNNAIKLVHTNIHIKINGRLINTAYPTEHQEAGFLRTFFCKTDRWCAPPCWPKRSVLTRSEISMRN